MTLAQVKQLASDLLDMSVGITVVVGTSSTSVDWKVIATPPGGVTADAKQIAQLETRYGITAPIPGSITFA